MRLIPAYVSFMNVQNQITMQKDISPTLIQDSHNGKINTILIQCSRHVTHYLKKYLIPEWRLKKIVAIGKVQ